MLDELRNMPKVLLHIHLDGSVGIETLSSLSGLSIEEVKNKCVYNKENQNNDYFSYIDFCNSLTQTKENLYIVSKDLVNSLAKENVVYAEVRLAPCLHMEKGLTFDDIITSVLAGFNTNPAVKINLVICLLRGATKYMNSETLKHARKYLGKGVCGIDITGDEEAYPLSMYSDFFKLATLEKIPFTIHAGDESVNDMYEALVLHTKRISTGIKTTLDLNLLRLVYYKRIMLELCPTSNLLRRNISDLSLHPIDFFYRNNFNISININNMTVEDNSITKEYSKLMETFKFTINDFKKMNINAIESSFLSKEEKNRYKKYFVLG